MKKKLIVISVLLASVAQAAIVQDNTQYVTFINSTNSTTTENSSSTLNQSNSQFTWNSALSGTLVDYALTFSADILTTDTSTEFLNLFRTCSNSDGLIVRVSNPVGDNAKLTLANGSNVLEGFQAIDFTEGTVYTLAILDSKAYLYEGTGLPTGEGYTLPTMAYNIKTDNGVAWANNSSGTPRNTVTFYTISALSNQAIPEPATATLSLLALAGLATRRRRK